MISSTSFIGAAAAAAALLAKPAFAQDPTTGGLVAPTTGGDPAARTGYSSARPTPSWSQWQPKPSIALSSLPYQYMGSNRVPNGPPQTGFNQCSEGWNQQSKCQTAWLNSADDFCLWGPPEPGTVGATEREAVAYCTKPTHGTRLIPDGTIFGSHFVQTPDYVQVTGVGDFSSIGIPVGDDGGEMDSAGMDDLSNPIGGIVYTTAQPSANGQPVMAAEWTNFMSWNQFCFRVCFGNNPERHCEHVYDVLGCRWNIPANYSAEVFETCDGDNAMFQGRYVQADGSTSTFSQGQPSTPQPHPAPSSSNCRAIPSPANRLISAVPSGQATSSTSAAAAPSNTGSAASGSGSGSTSSGTSPRQTGTAANNAAGAAATAPANAANTLNVVGIVGSAAVAAVAVALLA